MRAYQYHAWQGVLSWDVLAYYLYLPFTFIYDDPGISNLETIQYIFDTYNPSTSFYQAFKLENGNHSPMYTLGMAVFYAPFFFIGHLWASFSDYPADGFSFPYQFCIANGMMLYILPGIFITRKILKLYFNDIVTSVTLILMLLGTSYFHQTIADEVGPHALMFTCFSILLWLTIKWHKNPTIKTGLTLGFVAGLTIIGRGSGVVIGLLPLLWGVYNKETLLAKVDFVKKNIKSILVGAIGLLIIPLIQIIYWKLVTGKFIFNNYKVTPGFDYFEPHIIKVFFSYRKGWFLYTPMIAFVFIGLGMLWKKNKDIALPIILFFILNVYLISSWGTWWQGNSFACRYFVESYAILVLPLGYFVQWVLAKKWRIFALSPIAAFFLFINLFMTWQYNNWMFNGYTMTKDYYWRIFLNTSVTEEDKKLKGVERNFSGTDTFTDEHNYTKRSALVLDFDKFNTIPVSPFYINSDTAYSGENCCKITKDRIYGPTYSIHWDELTEKEHLWIRISCKYFVRHDLKESPASFVVLLNHNDGQYVEKYTSFDFEKLDTKIGEWNDFQADYLTPYPLSTKHDQIQIYPYIRGDQPLYLDDIHVEVFERNW